MAKQFNLFQSIISQIERNVKSEDNSNVIEISKLNKPTTVINILVDEGCFKVDSIKDKVTLYEIRYKDLNLNASRLKHLLRWDKSIDRETYNDTVRYDDYECKCVSKDVLTEWDGAYCKDTVDHLEYTDDCKFDLYAQMKGYTPEQLQSLIEGGYINKDIIQMEYIEFLEQCFAKDYEYGEDFEEEYV